MTSNNPNPNIPQLSSHVLWVPRIWAGSLGVFMAVPFFVCAVTLDWSVFAALGVGWAVWGLAWAYGLWRTSRDPEWLQGERAWRFIRFMQELFAERHQRQREESD